jgi:hypothetical protein
VLTVASAVAGYAAGQIGNGLGPEEARRAALDAAGELELIAGTLRRIALARLGPPERRRLVAELAASGMSQRRIAAAVGVAKRTVWGDLHRLAAVKVAPARRADLPRLAEVLNADRGEPPKMGREELLPLDGRLGDRDPPGGLLVADRGEGIIESGVLVADGGEVPFGVADGMIVHSQGSVLVRPRITALTRRRGRLFVRPETTRR